VRVSGARLVHIWPTSGPGELAAAPDWELRCAARLLRLTAARFGPLGAQDAPRGPPDQLSAQFSFDSLVSGSCDEGRFALAPHVEGRVSTQLMRRISRNLAGAPVCLQCRNVITGARWAGTRASCISGAYSAAVRYLRVRGQAIGCDTAVARSAVAEPTSGCGLQPRPEAGFLNGNKARNQRDAWLRVQGLRVSAGTSPIAVCDLRYTFATAAGGVESWSLST
jgi:hypothetical protein